MEFLMTYGWAILVVLIAIGALAYFGVLNPGRFLPSSCTVVPGIGCDDFKVNTSHIQLLLRNGIGSDLTSVWVSVPGCGISPEANGDDNWIDGTVLGGEASGILLGEPVPPAVDADVCTGLTVGMRFKADINLGYIANSGIQHNKTGSITTKVE